MERPFIHINCAATLDGKIARPDGSRLRISGPWDMERVHKLRSEMDAILVGANTVMIDDPKLSIKEEFVRDPPKITKIIMDGKGKVPLTSRFFKTPGQSMIITSRYCDKEWINGLQKMMDEDVDLQVLMLESKGSNIPLVPALLALREMGMKRILVEGGSEVIWNFVKEGLFDEFTIYFGEMMIGGNGPSILGGEGIADGIIGTRITSMQRTPDGGLLLCLRKKDGQ